MVLTRLILQVSRAFLLALGRSPTASEHAACVMFIEHQTEQRLKRGGKANAARLALADYCQTLFGLNEFLYVD